MRYVGTQDKATQYGDVFVTNAPYAGGINATPDRRGLAITGWNVLRIGFTVAEVGFRDCPCPLNNSDYGLGLATYDEAVALAKDYVEHNK